MYINILKLFSKLLIIIIIIIIIIISVSVAQWLEHCISSAKVVGSIPREHMH